LKNIFASINIFEIKLIKEIARQEEEKKREEDALTTIVIFDNFLKIFKLN